MKKQKEEEEESLYFCIEIENFQIDELCASWRSCKALPG
jgi:hypothetical protein